MRLGTRGSPLALRQTDLVRNALATAHSDLEIHVVVVETRGDLIRDKPVSEIGDKGIFVRAIEARLLDRTIDLAVHSLKDVPSDVESPGLAIAAFSPREDPRDVVIAATGQRLADLPPGARIGTGSARRRALLQDMRPDLIALDIRGNVGTRLRKLREGMYDAVILAAAGVLRLGLERQITEYLPLDGWPPDAGQGIIAVQGRAGDEATSLVEPIDCKESRQEAEAERAVARALNADCHSPVAALARVRGKHLVIDAAAARDDLRGLCRASAEGPADVARDIGYSLGTRLAAALGRGGTYTEV